MRKGRQVQLKIDRVAQERGYSIKKLAKESGVSYPTVHSLWWNRSIPSLATLEKLATTLGVSVKDLIDE